MEDAVHADRTANIITDDAAICSSFRSCKANLVPGTLLRSAYNVQHYIINSIVRRRDTEEMDNRTWF